MATTVDNQDGTLTIMLTEIEQHYWKWAMTDKLVGFERQISAYLEGKGREEFERRMNKLSSSRRDKLLSDLGKL